MFGPGKDSEPGDAPARTELTNKSMSHNHDDGNTRYIRTVPAIRRDDFVSNIHIRYRAYEAIGAHDAGKSDEGKKGSHVE